MTTPTVWDLDILAYGTAQDLRAALQQGADVNETIDCICGVKATVIQELALRYASILKRQPDCHLERKQAYAEMIQVLIEYAPKVEFCTDEEKAPTNKPANTLLLLKQMGHVVVNFFGYGPPFYPNNQGKGDPAILDRWIHESDQSYLEYRAQESKDTTKSPKE